MGNVGGCEEVEAEDTNQRNGKFMGTNATPFKFLNNVHNK
jgi:hypothetical protein